MLKLRVFGIFAASFARPLWLFRGLWPRNFNLQENNSVYFNFCVSGICADCRRSQTGYSLWQFILVDSIAHNGSQIACVGFGFVSAKSTRLIFQAHKSPHVRWLGLTVNIDLIFTVTPCKASNFKAFHTFEVSLLTVTSLVFLLSLLSRSLFYLSFHFVGNIHFFFCYINIT